MTQTVRQNGYKFVCEYINDLKKQYEKKRVRNVHTIRIDCESIGKSAFKPTKVLIITNKEYLHPKVDENVKLFIGTGLTEQKYCVITSNGKSVIRNALF